MARAGNRRRGAALLLGGVALVALPPSVALPPPVAVAAAPSAGPPGAVATELPRPAATAGPTTPSDAAEPSAPERYPREPPEQTPAVLSLGAGIALVGLGLAVLGWRLRR